MSSIRFAFKKWKKDEKHQRQERHQHQHQHEKNDEQRSRVHTLSVLSCLVVSRNAHICMYSRRCSHRRSEYALNLYSFHLDLRAYTRCISQFRLLEPKAYLNKIFQFK